jgi:acyl-CoA reductase-like NAD-dependent aldehyde dehydrogenase
VNDARPCWIAGTAEGSAESLTVTNPYDGGVVDRVAVPDGEQVERAVAAAATAASELAVLPAYRRADALRQVADRLRADRAAIAELIVAEGGKPVRWALSEVDRAAGTFGWAAEEARRTGGEMHPLDSDPAGVGRTALVRRVPRGPVLGITPFNFPLNLVAHKVAPALAVGAPIVLKPAPATPLSSLLLGELLAGTGLPAGAVSVLPLPNDRMPGLVADPRLPVVSFTGSARVGWRLRDAVPRKHATLELGGNAAAVVCDDWSRPGDLARAAQRIALFGMYQAGQSCIAVQRVIVTERHHEQLLDELVTAVQALPTGPPTDPATVVGPLIDGAAAARVESTVDDAVRRGARVLTGGRRDGTRYAPTVLVDVPVDAPAYTEEIFGPVVTVTPVPDDEAALAAVNASRYGLHAGVFTHDLRLAFRAYQTLEVGGVVIGDVPSYRADQLPYGGVKDSGVGVEGVRAAMTDLTQDRVLILSGLS